LGTEETNEPFKPGSKELNRTEENSSGDKQAEQEEGKVINR
jgi:hypothetical protein